MILTRYLRSTPRSSQREKWDKPRSKPLPPPTGRPKPRSYSALASAIFHRKLDEVRPTVEAMGLYDDWRQESQVAALEAEHLGLDIGQALCFFGRAASDALRHFGFHRSRSAGRAVGITTGLRVIDAQLCLSACQ
jgi:hypothetical protein